MTASVVRKKIEKKEFDNTLVKLYGARKLSKQRKRYTHLIDNFISLYGDLEVCLFSVPGRSEISGNHTDHNNGKVLAASVDIDIIAVAAKNDRGVIKIKSEGYREDAVEIDKLDPSMVRRNTSSAIIAGMCDAFSKSGYTFGGFYACTVSEVLTGSGLSSSAAFEVMCGNILSHLYNDGKVSPMELAKMGKYTENVFFGKPCGLMDQAACAYGGFLYIDFDKNDAPVIEKLQFDLTDYGYSLCIVNTGGNHADLTDDYASIPKDMHTCANLLGKNVLREVDEQDFISRIGYLRALSGDRAIVRAMHFFRENTRVEKQRNALKENNIDLFLSLVSESGDSSFKYLQNVYTNKNVTEQGLTLALALTENLGIFCRVHGGGFAGTIQAYVPAEKSKEYKKILEHVFGKGSCMFMKIRRYGAVKFDEKVICEGATE